MSIRSDRKHLICFPLSSKTIGSYKSSEIDKDTRNFGSKIQFPSEKWMVGLSHAGQLHICSFLLGFLTHGRTTRGGCSDGVVHGWCGARLSSAFTQWFMAEPGNDAFKKCIISPSPHRNNAIAPPKLVKTSLSDEISGERGEDFLEMLLYYRHSLD